MVPLQAPKGSSRLSRTFWGLAWCKHLETYQQYEARLPRGRSYLRQGNVYNLQVEPGRIRAVVAGSELYDVQIHLAPLPIDHWQKIRAAGAGQVESMLDRLSGKLGDGLMRVVSDREQGLFPKPQEIRFQCSCPDFADLCKHASAVLYGIAVVLDTRPDALFTLRGVDQADLLSEASQSTAAELADRSSATSLDGADLSSLFGIDLTDDAAPSPADSHPRL